PRRLDVLPANVGKRGQIAPPEMEARVESLGKDPPALHSAARGRLEKRDRVAALLPADSGGFQDGRKDVGQTHRPGDGNSPLPLADPFDKQGNAERLAIEKCPVLRL